MGKRNEQIKYNAWCTLKLTAFCSVVALLSIAVAIVANAHMSSLVFILIVWEA